MNSPAYRDPERLDLSSASSIETDVFCPGRRNLIATLPNEAFQQKEDKEAERGTRIHRARETGNTEELDEDDLDIHKRGLETESRILAQWMDDFGIELAQNGPCELRLFLHWPDTLKPATSAKIDVHYIAGNKILIVELKSLYCTNLTAAERNWQARVQAVVAAKEYGAMHVRVAFNKAMWGRADAVDYGTTDLVFAENSIFQRIWETQQPEAPLNPGPHCRYCIAKPYCKPAAAYSMLPSTIGDDPVAMVQQLPPADLVKLWRSSAVITKIFDAVKERLKGMSEEELSELGLKRSTGRKLDPITKTKAAFDALKAFGIDESELWEALSFSKGELVNAVRRDQGWSEDQTKGFLWGNILKPFLEEKTSEAGIEEI